MTSACRLVSFWAGCATATAYGKAETDAPRTRVSKGTKLRFVRFILFLLLWFCLPAQKAGAIQAGCWKGIVNYAFICEGRNGSAISLSSSFAADLFPSPCLNPEGSKEFRF